MQTRSCKAQYGGRFEGLWDTVLENDHCEFELSVGVFPVPKQASCQILPIAVSCDFKSFESR